MLFYLNIRLIQVTLRVLLQSHCSTSYESAVAGLYQKIMNMVKLTLCFIHSLKSSDPIHYHNLNVTDNSGLDRKLVVQFVT